MSYESYELSLQELDLQGADLLPDRTALQTANGGGSLFGDNVAVAVAVQGAQAQANQGVFFFYGY